MEMIIIFLILLFLDSVADIIEKVLDRLPRKRKKKRRDGIEKHRTRK